MPKRSDIKSILIIGSGPIVIGQACEFDYSGVQALKALKEEGFRVILVNSNPATIMTDPNFADRTYIEPITCEFVTRVIERERPDALLPTLGGQTALNVTIELDEAGVLDRYNVELIGASVQAIKTAEDRDSFKQVVEACGLESAKSYVVHTIEEAEEAVASIGYPFIIRPSRTLGGAGGGTVERAEEFQEKVAWGLECSPIDEILIEESLSGWKEMELEVMRDKKDNAVVICGIENIDPMGQHTGDSITVAPIQTLTDKEYQALRDGALKLMRAIGVDTGGSNVQFAIDPKDGRQIVIEMNPRVSRSSALASKATGFPIAKIAAKLAVGYSLDELPNDITKETPASFEPSIDYVVVKIPRFTFEKFQGVEALLGTQMKSVGEAMSIGRTFPEALQKACRSLETGRTGILGGPEGLVDDIDSLKRKVRKLTPDRLYQTARLIQLGVSVEELFEETAYDLWFLREIKRIVDIESELSASSLDSIDEALLRPAKQLGMSDMRIAELLACSEGDIRAKRSASNIRPSFKMVDTCAAEFASNTPYLYSTYDSTAESTPSKEKKIIILGGGPNRIGQGLEFDYCCVHAAFSLREAGYETIMINCNPETVSTDYDTSDRLYFEPLTLEDVLAICEHESPDGVIVQYGGQTPLRLAQSLKAAGVPIIGTSPDSIDLTEDREQFSNLLTELGLKQSPSGTACDEAQAVDVANKIGYPLMVRPSFVLGGRAMAIITNEAELRNYIAESVEVSFERPVLLDRFLSEAIEVDVDAICDGEKVVVAGLLEHIERAGVHSGDSSFMIPAQTLSAEVMLEIEEATRALALRCGVRGLMNVQFASNKSGLYVLEVNPRASRSVPFVSKTTAVPWAKVAARVMAGDSLKALHESGLYGDILVHESYRDAVGRIPYVAVKESVFPFVKFHGADTVLGPEMRSTGEVMGIDDTLAGGFVRAHVATGMTLPDSGTVFVSVRDEDKVELEPIVRKLVDLGFSLIATDGTAKYLNANGFTVERINKVRDGSPHIVDRLNDGGICMVINTPEGTGPLLDSRTIRSTSTQLGLPLFTTLAAARAAVDGIELKAQGQTFEVCSIQEFLDLL
jgi:carbamoyl-phosphate synthase large subunit